MGSLTAFATSFCGALRVVREIAAIFVFLGLFVLFHTAIFIVVFVSHNFSPFIACGCVPSQRPRRCGVPERIQKIFFAFALFSVSYRPATQGTDFS
jgi:hypothetical protein